MLHLLGENVVKTEILLLNITTIFIKLLQYYTMLLQLLLNKY